MQPLYELGRVLRKLPQSRCKQEKLSEVYRRAKKEGRLLPRIWMLSLNGRACTAGKTRNISWTNVWCTTRSTRRHCLCQS